MTPSKDEKGLITKEMSEILHERIFSFGGSKTLTDAYVKLVKNEPNVAIDIDDLVQTYSKNAIGTLMTMMMRRSVIDDKFFNSLNLPMRKMFQNAIGAGVIYSQAKMEQDFINSMKISLEENMNTSLDESLLMEEEKHFFQPEDDDDGDISIQ